MSAVAKLQLDAFAASAARDDGQIQIELSGTADHAVIAGIEAFLVNVHEVAAANAVRRATVDVRALEFMNSSCFKSFVTWIAAIQELPHDAKYHVEFWSNPSLPWQKRSLHTLQCFATDLITVVEHA